MRIAIKRTPESYIPVQANPTDAGYDLIAVSEPKIVGTCVDEKNQLYVNIQYIEYRTGLFISPQPDTRIDGARGDLVPTQRYHTELNPRSSISKYNLVLANSIGLIDEAYRGELICRFKYIWQPGDMIATPKGAIVGKPNSDSIYKKGDKIVQLKIEKTISGEFFLVDTLDETARGEGGFGSSGN